MRKVWLCIFYALCIFTIVFSLFCQISGAKRSIL